MSGTLLVPKTDYPFGRRPIVGYAVGTHGMGDTVRPLHQHERGPRGGAGPHQPLPAEGFRRRGHRLRGARHAGTHTYMGGDLPGPRAVLDSVRAAMRVPDARLSADAPVAIMGYSQGGSSAAWAGTTPVLLRS
ncbi:hypothetical protein GCM10020219_038540 [Nonomuraea dietziae]